MQKCLYCYKDLKSNEIDFHTGCSKKIFGMALPPAISYTESEMEELGLKVVKSQMTLTGVQAKLSLDISPAENKNDIKRFTIVGLWGSYILKPPTQQYAQLPEVEDVCMHLAEISNIKVVPHSLIRLQSGNLAYITKRIDRNKKTKFHMEDMCQLTEHLTEDKYQGSYEQVAKTIYNYSSHPGLDIVNFSEQLLFSFLTGNADMHLKNFSLINLPATGYVLAPAYDLVSTALVNPADDEDMALTLNGKKKKLNSNDFVSAFKNFKIDSIQQENIFRKMKASKIKWMEFIDISFLSNDFKTKFKNLINERFSRLNY